MTQPESTAQPEVPTRVAIIGLGNMGTPMAARLGAAGHTVVGFDVSEEARDRLVKSGGTAASSATDAVADADVVILMLPNSSIVESVLAEQQLATALETTKPLIVDMSSSEPLRTRKLAADLDALGITLIDAPVSGGVSGAVNGKLTIMVGATDEQYATVEPLLSALGRTVHAGAVGSGHAAKALNNLLSATHLWVTSEAILAGERFGIDPEVLLSIFNGSSGRSGSTENKWPNFILPGSYDSGFGLALMLKDMRIATGLAQELGAPSTLGADAVELWARAAQDLPPTADHTEVARWLRDHTERGAAMAE